MDHTSLHIDDDVGIIEKSEVLKSKDRQWPAKPDEIVVKAKWLKRQRRNGTEGLKTEEADGEKTLLLDFKDIFVYIVNITCGKTSL